MQEEGAAMGSRAEDRQMNSSLIYTGIVSFNPDMARLRENIEAVRTQTDTVLVYDNGSANQGEVRGLMESYDNVLVLVSDRNKGIASALNALMQWGEDRGYGWMLSLDQDSVCGADYVDRMLPYLHKEPDIGIAAPVIVDRNVGIVGHNPSQEYAHVNTCITSGAMVNIQKWEETGRYDEHMFIDSVDFEFCYRMRKRGYGVIQVRDVHLLHEIGTARKRRFLFWSVRVSGHSAFRQYYIARNNIYYPKKHHLWLHLIRANIRNLWLLIKIVLYEDDDRTNKITAVINGWKDGYRELRHED